jgi:FtsH-binding integral membrane protein
MRQWFGPKTIGYGIGPRSWEGWLVVLVFCAGAALIAKWLPFGSHDADVMRWTAWGLWLALLLVVVVLTSRPDKSRR